MIDQKFLDVQALYEAEWDKLDTELQQEFEKSGGLADPFNYLVNHQFRIVKLEIKELINGLREVNGLRDKMDYTIWINLASGLTSRISAIVTSVKKIHQDFELNQKILQEREKALGQLAKNPSLSPKIREAILDAAEDGVDV